MSSQLGPIITIDIDWAPDFIIDHVATILLESNVRATWFVTHQSSAIDRLRKKPSLFELGIHPNFMPGSTHGETPSAVMAHCRRLVPDAVSMRTHGHMQSWNIFEEALDTFPISVDVSVYMPYASNVEPVRVYYGNKYLTRLAFVWEDHLETLRPSPTWSPTEIIERCRGLKILNFHPVHIYLNTRELKQYRSFKERCAVNRSLSDEDIRDLVTEGEGPRKMFERTVKYLLLAGGGRWIREFE